jgi:phenylalanyl-tRNA synthetase alpha chain
MKDKIEQLIQESQQAVITTKEQLEAFKLKFLVKKGLLNQLVQDFKNLPGDEKRKWGKDLNIVKQKVELIFSSAQEKLLDGGDSFEQESTLPGYYSDIGSRHPISFVVEEMTDIFSRLGFSVAVGPEVEDDWHNFSALNFPPNHPARDMQDTFYIKQEAGEKLDLLMRTHTSNQQVRAIERLGTPLRAIFPGKCFRNEATDASHDNTFYQLEGLMIDKNISIANLVSVMNTLLSRVFEKDVKTRLRPGYFPFVEPGFELDFSCVICGGKGCSVCGDGWVELMPCGLIHPEVLKAGGLDPKEWSGFAFGMGVERLAMLRYGIDDLRLFFANALRFLRQF